MRVAKFGSDRFGLLLQAGDDLRITIGEVSFVADVALWDSPESRLGLRTREFWRTPLRENSHLLIALGCECNVQRLAGIQCGRFRKV